MDIPRSKSATSSAYPQTPVLVVHGGAWAIPDDMVEAHQKGVRHALAAGWRALEKGATALDAVEEAVVVMEDDDTFDAGRGSFLNRDGKVQLDALIMDGATLRAGGVGCVERVRNAVRVARRVLEDSPHCYFVGEGAERFASEHGIPLIDNSELVVERERKRLDYVQQQRTPNEMVNLFVTEHDTVGAIALDKQGKLAAATSTGGTLNKAPGRVGDSSLIGCGCYADEMAAVSTTGWGEPMMKLVLGKWAVDRVHEGRSPEAVALEAMAYLKARADGHGGVILLDRNGRIGLAHNTPRMAYGYKSNSSEMSGIDLRTV